MAAEGRLRVVEGPTGPRDDATLMRAFLGGDRAAFGELVRRHQRPVLSLLRRYAPRAADADDLAQRAFLRALEAAERVLRRRNAAQIPFRQWVVRIALNLAKNQLRDARRHTLSLTAVVDVTPHAPADSQLEIAERSRRVRAAILQLPRRQRDVLTLRIDAELSFAEVAGVLRTSENSAKVTFHHALVKLRQLTREEEPS